MGLAVNFAAELKVILPPSRISHLDLSKNNLGNSGVILLMRGVKESLSLATLNLASNDISSEGMVAIAKSLHRNESLSALNLSTLEGVSRNRMNLAAMEEFSKLF